MKGLKVFCGFLLLATCGSLFAEEATIKGEVIDLSCYLHSGARGEKHMQCAASCIEGGLPMGILTEKGEVYLLIENHKQKDAYATAKKNAAQQVEVKGEVAEKGGVRAITVNTCNKI